MAVTRPILPLAPRTRTSGGPPPRHAVRGWPPKPSTAPPAPSAGAPLPGKNLTRDEATARAAVIAVDHYDVDPRPHHLGHHVPQHDHGDVHERRARRAATFVDLIAPSVEAITLNGEPLDPATHFDGVRVSRPVHGGAQHAHGRRHRGIHEHRRGAAPLHRPGGRRGLPLLAVRGGRLPPDVRGLRAARPQGDLRVHRDRPGRTGRWCPTPPRPSRPRPARAPPPGRSRRPRGCPATSPR